MSSFTEKVYKVVSKIPKGKVLRINKSLKKPATVCLARGWEYFEQKFNPAIPCHRVIKSNRKIGGYNRGTKAKIKILEDDGFIV